MSQQKAGRSLLSPSCLPDAIDHNGCLGIVESSPLQPPLPPHTHCIIQSVWCALTAEDGAAFPPLSSPLCSVNQECWGEMCAGETMPVLDGLTHVELGSTMRPTVACKWLALTSVCFSVCVCYSVYACVCVCVCVCVCLHAKAVRISCEDLILPACRNCEERLKLLWKA